MRRFARRLLACCPAASLVLCVAVCAFWLVAPLLRAKHTEFELWERRDGSLLTFSFYADTVQFARRDPLPPPSLAARLRQFSSASVLDQTLSAEPVPGVTVHGRRTSEVLADGTVRWHPRVRTVSVHYAVPALLAAVLPAAWAARRWRRSWVAWARRGKGCCPACGYDLRASAGQCPECGGPAHADALDALWGRHLRR